MIEREKIHMWRRRYRVMLAVAAVGWLLALLAIAELLSLYL